MNDTDDWNPKRILTPAEAGRAIYIDFEGRTDEAPALLGVLYAEGKHASPDRLVLRHDVLDPAMAPLVGAATFESVHRYDTRACTLPQALADVLRRAKHQNRLIVSWSQHEGRIIGEAGNSAWVRRQLGRRYVDGKAMAKRWRTQRHPDLKFTFDTHGGANKLIRYLPLVGYELPDSYGSGKVGGWIHQTRDALQRRPTWEKLTAPQQQRWLDLLEHNAHDLFGLRAVVERAAADLASPPDGT